MGLYPVSDAKEKALLERMDSLGISEEDIYERFVRSGGPGGQNVNKTATCVQLKHRPSGLEVKCSRTRTQGLNRYYARITLADKLERLIKGRQSEERKRIEKIRRQKRKRSKRAKEKILEEKRRVSDKKRLRAPLKAEDDTP